LDDDPASVLVFSDEKIVDPCVICLYENVMIHAYRFNNAGICDSVYSALWIGIIDARKN